jgi:hypothetical protein
MFHRNIFKGKLSGTIQIGRAVLFALPRNPVGFLTLFAVRMSIAQSVSLSADSDKGFSPLTSAAFFIKLLHQKILCLW